MVDDDATNLAVGYSALAEKYNVFTAASGESLFQILYRVSPDIILLDIEMPGMNGYDVIKELKSSEHNKHIPVIFLSGHTETVDQSEGIELGAVGYVTKPYTREQLAEQIDKHI